MPVRALNWWLSLFIVTILLLDKGADVNAQGSVFGNALQAASQGGHQEIIALLLNKSVDINAKAVHSGTSSNPAKKLGLVDPEPPNQTQ